MIQVVNKAVHKSRPKKENGTRDKLHYSCYGYSVAQRIESVIPQFITLPLSKDQEMMRDSDAKARAKIPRAPS